MTTDELGNVYVFDAWNHVVQINNSGGTTLETFAYDALGRNVQVNNGSGFDTIAYDTAGRQVQSSFGSTYVQNVWGLAYINDLLLRDRNQDGNTSTGNLGFTGSGLEEREYAQHDQQFSVISLTDPSGSVIQRIAYDPYGKATLLTANWTYDSTQGGTNYWIVMFQGMTLVGDGPSANLEQSASRVYNVDLGRWGSQDRGYWDGSNVYQAFASNPSAYRDPNGTMHVDYDGGSDPYAPARPPVPPVPPAKPYRPAKLMCTDFFAPRSKFDNVVGGWLYNIFSATPVSGFWVFGGPNGKVGPVAVQAGGGFSWDIDNGYYVGPEFYAGNSQKGSFSVGGWFPYSQDEGWNSVDPFRIDNWGAFGGVNNENNHGVDVGVPGDRGTTYPGINLGFFSFGVVINNQKAAACCKKLIGSPPPVTPLPSPTPPHHWWENIDWNSVLQAIN